MSYPIRLVHRCVGAVLLAVMPFATHADGPTYTATGELARPADYRSWVYLTSGLDMFYGERRDTSATRPAVFDNVFVTRAAYDEFMRSGTWPESAMFILELRRAERGVSIDNAGQTQGAVVAIEAAVKDSARFASIEGSNGWGYFTFDGPNGLLDSARALPSTAACYACHATNTAVDNTFVQFYPTLLEVAQRLGTVRPDYDPTHKLP